MKSAVSTQLIHALEVSHDSYPSAYLLSKYNRIQNTSYFFQRNHNHATQPQHFQMLECVQWYNTGDFMKKLPTATCAL